jgi:hypothetical protein
VKKILFFSVILITLFSFTYALPNIIEGTVVSEKTGKPVSNAHVYIVHGEEETLTNSKGEFRIESWKKLPVILTVDHKEYEKIRISISTAPGKHVVRVKPK